MRFVLAGIVVLAMILLAVGALAGRVRARSCCAVADPSRDLRMRAARPEQPDPNHRGPGADRPPHP